MIHIFFDASAAGTFRQLLRARRIAEPVVGLSEALDFGPISQENLACREQWLNQHVPLDFGDHDWLAESEAMFQKHVSNNPERLVWLSPASAMEQAGLYWYLSQVGGFGLKLAIADFPFAATWNGKSPLKLGELGVEAMGQLYDECPRTLWDRAHFPEDRWTALVADNALLRVVIDGHLQSAPDDYFDNFLLARCTDSWENWQRIIGVTMGKIWDTGQSAGSDLLLWRLRALIENGHIACQGDLPRFGASVSNATKIRRAG